MHQPDILVAAKAVDLASNQGVFYQALTAPNRAITQKEFLIYGRSITSLNGLVGDAVGGGWVNGTTTTSLALATASLNKLTIGCVLKVEDEMVIVKAIDRSAQTIDVWSRGAGSTSGAAHVDTTPFTVIGHSIHDTDLKNITARAEVTNKYINYCLTIAEIVEYTKSQQILGRDGLADPIGTANFEAMRRVAEILARASLQGMKVEGTKAGDPYMSAGLYDQLEDTASGIRAILRHNASSVALSKTVLDSALEEAFLKGKPDVIWCTQKYKNIINAFNQSFINTNRIDKTAGYSVSEYEYEGKILKIKVDQDCVDTKLAICTQAKLQKGFQSDEMIRFAKEPGGSSRETRHSLSGSLGFIVEGVGYDHLEIYNLL